MPSRVPPKAKNHAKSALSPASDNTADTIAALATPAGIGAIGVVRVSGASIAAIAKRLIGELPPPRLASLRLIRDTAGEVFDQAIVLYFPAPASFTGEDVLEIQTHGGVAVLEQTLQACFAFGARQARPGEFTERAFFNGKLDLMQAEAVADLIASGSQRAARSAFNSMRGFFSREVTDIAERIKAMRIEVEAIIDFPEDDLPQALAAQLNDGIAAERVALQKILSKARSGVLLNRGLDVAIVGKPNVGKSTLLNYLAREDRAITSDTPGTTRDILSIDTHYQGYAIRFHDTAGLRNTPSDEIEAEGMRRAKLILDKVDIVLYLDEVLETKIDLPYFQQPTELLIVQNKIDLSQDTPGLMTVEDKSVCRVSAKTGAGIDDLITFIVRKAGGNNNTESVFSARERHIKALENALKALDFEFARVIDDSPELIAEHLRIVQQHLGELLGEYTSEDLLGDIFSSFCIGK